MTDVLQLAARVRPQPSIDWALPIPPTPASLGYPSTPPAPTRLHTFESTVQCRLVFRWWNEVRSFWCRPVMRHFRGRYDQTKWAPVVLAGIVQLEQEQRCCVVDWLRHVQALPSASVRSLPGAFAPGLIASVGPWVHRQYPLAGGGARIMIGQAYQIYMTRWHETLASVRIMAGTDGHQLRTLWDMAQAALVLDRHAVEVEALNARRTVANYLDTGAWIWPFTAAGV